MNSALRMKETSWLLVIAGLWALMASVPSIERLLPASIWFSVSDVRVFDARVGQSPLMVVKREVKRPFQARWVAEVERWEGQYFVVLHKCTGRGENNYSPDNDLPRPLNLTWWVYPADCVLPPGQYRIETRWTLARGQEVRALSNLFAVTN